MASRQKQGDVNVCDKCGDNMNFWYIFDGVSVSNDDVTESKGNDVSGEKKAEYKVECQPDFVVDKGELINAQKSDDNSKVLWNEARRA